MRSYQLAKISTLAAGGRCYDKQTEDDKDCEEVDMKELTIGVVVFSSERGRPNELAIIQLKNDTVFDVRYSLLSCQKRNEIPYFVVGDPF